MGQAVELLYSFTVDDRAATAIEYALIASIISVAIITAAIQIGVNLQLIFEDAAKF